MCSGPVRISTELSPITPLTGELPAAEGASSAGAVKIVLTSSGALSSTSCMRLGQKVIVNASPICRAQRSIIHVGATAQISVCAKAGRRGPGGSPVAAPSADAGTGA